MAAVLAVAVSTVVEAAADDNRFGMTLRRGIGRAFFCCEASACGLA